MSKRLDVLKAVCTLVADALPAAEVLGLDKDTPAPTRIPAGGRAVIRSGDPGEPEMTLGILRYSYSHSVPVELDAYPTDTLTREEALDTMAAAIGAAVEADRSLGGLVEFLDVEALETDEIPVTDGKAAKSGQFAIVAEYTTSNPLT